MARGKNPSSQRRMAGMVEKYPLMQEPERKSEKGGYTLQAQGGVTIPKSYS